MGVKMDTRIKIFNRLTIIVVFVMAPIALYVFGYFPRRTLLKEAISLVTILAFFVMLMLFYLSRANITLLRGNHFKKVIQRHKALGYIFVSVILVHPFLVVLPRYFEPGISLNEAFLELISNFDKKGLWLGLLAWCLVIILGVISYFRDKLPMKYNSWRILHGILSIVFICVASLHVIDMGRHINQPMIILISILTLYGVAMLLKPYFFYSSSHTSIDNE